MFKEKKVGRGKGGGNKENKKGVLIWEGVTGVRGGFKRIADNGSVLGPAAV